MNVILFSKKLSPYFVLSGLFVLFACGCDQDRGDKRVVQKITCVNNLKQIGLAFRIWAGDHGDKFPFQVSTNAGGTLELCDRDTNGFECHSFSHFLVVSDELSTPLVLYCPHDEAKSATKDWGGLAASNVTYVLRSDFKVRPSNPHQVLAVCPVDGNIVYCDGTVKESVK